jgi:membrane-bound inhibitor of C-type lysozyme
MTRNEFMEMAKAVVGSGTYTDGQKFSFYVKGSSVIIQTETKQNKKFPYHCQGWELDEDGEPYCYGEWLEP